jgi:hypothetical protein
LAATFLAATFLAGALAGAFFAGAFLAATSLAGALAGAFFAGAFLAATFWPGAFFAFVGAAGRDERPEAVAEREAPRATVAQARGASTHRQGRRAE